MKKILIIGDSLSMSRHVDGITYDVMYSTLLSNVFRDWLVVNGSQRANTSRRVVDRSYQEEYLLPLRPDFVILQIGVVDCLPRLLSRTERIALSILTKLNLTSRVAKYYISYKSSRRLRFTKRKQMFFVDALEFQKNLLELKKILSELTCKVIVINIPCPGQKLRERSYGVDASVLKYNNIICTVFGDLENRIIDLYEMTRCDPLLLLSDGYHIQAGGHKLIFEEILKSGLMEPRDLPE